VRIGSICHDWGQKTPDIDFTYIEVSAIDSLRGVISSSELVNPENTPSRARKIVKKGTVMYSTIRPYLLNIAVIEDDFQPEPIASTAFAIVHPFCLMPPRYFLSYFGSPVFVRFVESVQMGIAYLAINNGQFFSGLIALPPIAEQHRMVYPTEATFILYRDYVNRIYSHRNLSRSSNRPS
jgi:type I restriction enzyme, S subunit